MLKNVLDAMFLNYEGTKAAVTDVKIVNAFDKRVFFEGCVNAVPEKWFSWSVQAVYPDTDVRENGAYEGIPDYNLPKVIEIY